MELKIKNLSKSFEGVKAVDDLSLELKSGIVNGIVGPNGSGKTTFVNLLSGLLPYDKGVVVIENTKIKKMKPFESLGYGVTRTFQDVRLFEQMKVIDNILIVLTKKDVFGSLFERQSDYQLNTALDILKKVGLYSKRNELALNLSYGQRKLLEIGRALATKSDVYLFDEPFAGLFKEIKKDVIKLINELKKENKTVILIEHDMDLIRELTDQLFVIDAGKLLASGKSEDVLANKKVIKAYLGN